LVLLTARGRAVRPIGSTAGRRVEEHWADLTSPETVETMRATMRQLIEALDGPDRGVGA